MASIRILHSSGGQNYDTGAEAIHLDRVSGELTIFCGSFGGGQMTIRCQNVSKLEVNTGSAAAGKVGIVPAGDVYAKVLHAAGTQAKSPNLKQWTYDTALQLIDTATKQLIDLMPEAVRQRVYMQLNALGHTMLGAEATLRKLVLAMVEKENKAPQP